MSKIENIVFYFPYKAAGGVSELFLNVSEILVNKYNVFIIDFEDGYMAKNLKPNTKLITIDQIDNIPKKDTIFVFQSIPIWNIIDFQNFDNNFKIILWNLHPNNLYPKIISNITNSILKNIFAKSINWLSFLRIRKLKNTVDYLLENDSIFFMDGENINTTYNYLKIQNNKRPLVPVIIPERQKVLSTLNNETLIFAWIGRIADFKIHILIHLLERLNAIHFSKKVYFKVIGSGDEISFFQNSIVNFTNLNIILLGECTKIEENEHFQDVNILFAMGMSALEGAARSIPTFILDYSYKPISKIYKFIYSYENSEYNLGREINASSYENICSLQKKIYFVLNNYELVSQKNYEWWKLNYSNHIIYNILELNLLDNAKATFGEIKKRKYNKADKISLVIKKIISLFKKEASSRIAYFNQF